MKSARLTILICLVLPLMLSAQVSFSSFLNHVNSLPAAARQTAADSFMTVVVQNGGTPVIGNDTACFIYRGSASGITVSGDFNGWSAGNALTQIASTNLFYYRQAFEHNARVDYKFVLNGSNWILDPQNPHTCSGGYGPNSELAMPGYIQPWEIKYRGGINHGSKVQCSLYSSYLSASYSVIVYLPPDYYSHPDKHYPAAYFHDGSEYISLGYADNIIDNLLDSSLIRPFVGVFVVPINRNDEYAGAKRNAYRQFFVYELVPFIDSVYRTIKDPGQRLIIGTSYGANISGLISYYHSNIFGKAGLHSPAIYPNNYEVLNLFALNPKIPVDICSVWGTYESTYQYMRPWRDSLLAKGYVFGWQEFPEGHSWGLWRATTDNFLKFFFPPEPSKIIEQPVQPASLVLLKNYPNPFNPSTRIEFFVLRKGAISLDIYDVRGCLVRHLIDGIYDRGNYSAEFIAGSLASGVYFAQLRTEGQIKRLKILLLR